MAEAVRLVRMEGYSVVQAALLINEVPIPGTRTGTGFVFVCPGSDNSSVHGRVT